MMGLIRDLPDWATGGLVAAGVWFGVSYAVLAPRVMEEEVETSLMPACMAQLESEQETAVAEATDRATRAFESERRVQLDEVARRERQLRELQSQVDAYAMTSGAIMGSPLGDLLNATGMAIPSAPGGVSRAEVRRMRQAVRQARQAVERMTPDIDFPRVPDAELLTMCGCATLQAMAGKRTDYALSLASFRMMSPASITSGRTQMSSALRWEGCGEKKWEDL